MPETNARNSKEEGNLERMPIHVIACHVLQDLLEPLLPDDLAEDVTFQEYGLHRVPDKLTRTIQERIDAVEEPSLIVLGYGLCGNGVQGVKSRQHTLLIPRTDDCIAILLGSRRAYRREFNAVPGTYYLSKGWLESGSHPLSEYQEYAEKYGREDAEWILDQQYQHYERVALVAHSKPALEASAPAAREVARFCKRWDMRYEEILGSDDYVRRLIDAAIALRDGATLGEDGIERDFVVVPPGNEVRTSAFVLGT
jgi:hypothetical protein